PWTGATIAGDADPSHQCSSWRRADPQTTGNVGHSPAGPILFSFGRDDCGAQHPLFCVGTDRSMPPPPRTGGAGNRSVLRAGWDPASGRGAARALCPGGTLANASALIAVGLTPASTFLTASASYVRIDGVRVGSGGDLELGTLESGIWQTD